MAQFTNVDAISESPVLVKIPPSADSVAGRLRFDPNGEIALQLLLQADIGAVLSKANAEYPSIQGRLVSGPPITLIDCMVSNTNFGMAGIADVQIVSNTLLVGMQLPDPASSPFDEVRVAMTGLNEWFSDSPLIMSRFEDLPRPEVGRLATITCKHLPRFGFSPTTGGPSLISDQIINTSCDGTKTGTIATQCQLSLRPRGPFGLRECAFELFRLQALMSILCGHQLYYQHATLYLHGTQGSARQATSVQYMPRFARPRSEPKKRYAHQLLVPLSAIRESLPLVWGAWTDRYKLYRSAVELFASTELFDGQLLNFQLLAIMQALETLHRNRFGGNYANEDQYSQIAVALFKAIPASTESDLRSSLNAKLKYGNEYSLRKRLRNMAANLPGGATGTVARLVHPSLLEFLNKSVETRNYLTHYTDELEPKAFRDGELYWATRLLRWFFVTVLLHDLGLPEGQLVDALGRADDLTHARQRLA